MQLARNEHSPHPRKCNDPNMISGSIAPSIYYARVNALGLSGVVL